MESRLMYNTYFPVPGDYFDFAEPMESQYTGGSYGSVNSYNSVPVYSYPQSNYGLDDTSRHGSCGLPNYYTDPTLPTTHYQTGHTGYRYKDATADHHSVATAKDGKGERIPCMHRDCQDAYGQPRKTYSRKADVARHIKSTHEPQFIDCPKKRCDRKGDKGFTRPDHLTEHLRGYHAEHIPKRNNSGASAVTLYSSGSRSNSSSNATDTTVKFTRIPSHASR